MQAIFAPRNAPIALVAIVCGVATDEGQVETHTWIIGATAEKALKDYARAHPGTPILSHTVMTPKPARPDDSIIHNPRLPIYHARNFP